MYTVLLIDDEETLRQVLREPLREAGYRVVEGKDGVEAIALVRLERPDIVLIDIIMPNMEGIETIALLREAWPELRIVAMSGGGRVTTDDLLKMARDLGADCTVTKPFRIKEMLGIVAGLLPERQSA